MAWLLGAGRDAAAVELSEPYPEDFLPETTYGRALALFRLGRAPEADATLRSAMDILPWVAVELLKTSHRAPRGVGTRYEIVGGRIRRTTTGKSTVNSGSDPTAPSTGCDVWRAKLPPPAGVRRPKGGEKKDAPGPSRSRPAPRQAPGRTCPGRGSRRPSDPCEELLLGVAGPEVFRRDLHRLCERLVPRDG